MNLMGIFDGLQIIFVPITNMSEVKISLEEELSSPELFSDPEGGTNASGAGTSDESTE